MCYEKGSERNENKILILMYDSALYLSQNILWRKQENQANHFFRNLELSTYLFEPYI